MLRQVSSYAFMLTALAGLSACGGQSGDAAKPAGNTSAASTSTAPAADGNVTIMNVSYDVMRDFYKEYNCRVNLSMQHFFLILVSGF